METKQTSIWSGTFGREYTDRNTYADLDELDGAYTKVYGTSVHKAIEEMLEGLDRNLKILEVGSNVGLKLKLFQSFGFSDLYGIELQQYAVEKSKEITSNINIIQGSAFDIPFKDGFFDFVMTNGVLIHIHPDDISTAQREIVRCSSRFVWGFEQYAEKPVQVEYRGMEGAMWNSNYSEQYRALFPELREVRGRRLPLVENPSKATDVFLLEKTGASG